MIEIDLTYNERFYLKELLKSELKKDIKKKNEYKKELNNDKLSPSWRECTEILVEGLEKDIAAYKSIYNKLNTL